MKESSAVSGNLPYNPLLMVLTGPSGVGKDTVLNRLKEMESSIFHVTTMTTRSRRASEQNQREYHFTSREKFQELIKNNLMLEWAEVYGNLYGVPREPVKQALARGQDVVVKVDIQGAFTIKKLVPQAVTVFIAPPSMEELLSRLKGRRTESPEDLSLRLKTAEEEMKQMPLFDHTVTNSIGEIDKAVSEIRAIIASEKSRETRKKIRL